MRAPHSRAMSPSKLAATLSFDSVSPEPAIPARDGYLEAATTDTYLAVEEAALDLEEV